MSNLIVIVIGIVAIILGVYFAVSEKGWFSVPFILAGICIAIIGSSFSFVPSGYVGVRTAYGQISDKPVSQGMNWHIPFVEKIHNVNCKQQEKDFGSLQIWSETSERTEVYCEHVVIDYQINPEYVSWIWVNIEEWDTNLVKQISVESGVKSATKKFDDTNVTDRAQIQGAAKTEVQRVLDEKYGNRIVNVVSVSIGNINFTDAYNAAIEQKAQAKLAAETAEYVNKQTTQKVQAEAEQKKIAAEAEAQSILTKAEAQAEANKKIAESLTPELVEQQKIEKWDGKLPIISGDSIPMIDMGNIVNDLE